MSPNPFTPFQRQLAEVNYMAGGAAFQAVITTYQVLLGISILLIASSLWIRLRKAPESVWLVRMSKGLIRPNYIFAALLFSSIFAVLELFCLQSIRKYGDINNMNRRDAVTFRTLRYIPLWIGAWILTWTTILESTHASTERMFDLESYPRLVNTFFLGVPAILFTLLVSLTIVSDFYWKQVLVIYGQLKVNLDLAADNFDKGIFADIAALRAQQQQLDRTVVITTFYWTKANAILTGFILILFILFSLASFMYFRNLRYAIRSIKETSNPGLDSSKRLRDLQKLYTSLLVTTLVVEAIILSLMIPSFYISLNLTMLGVVPEKAALVNLWSMGVYAIFGLLLNAALFYRSLSLLKVQKNAATSSHPPSQNSVKLTLVTSRASKDAFQSPPQTPKRSQAISLELDEYLPSPNGRNYFSGEKGT